MEFDFSQKVDSLDTVPKDFQGLYSKGEDDKGYVLRSDDEAVTAAVSAITGLNRSLKASRAETRALKGNKVDLSVLSEYGDAPDKILEGFKTTLADATKGTKTQEDFQRQISKVKGELAEAHKTELGARDTRIEALTGQLHGILVTGEAKSALGEHGSIDADLALPFLARQIKVSEEDGKFSVNVVDAAGDPRYSGVTGAPMSVNELVAEMKSQEKYGPLFKSDGKSGAGTPADGARRQQGKPQDTKDMSPTQKIKKALDDRAGKR